MSRISVPDIFRRKGSLPPASAPIHEVSARATDARPESDVRLCLPTCWIQDYPPEPTWGSQTEDNFASVDNDVMMIAQIYKPLKPWQTRILCLECGGHEQPLTSKLVEADLIYSEGVVIQQTGQNVSYEALSYSWGTSSPRTMRLQCNGLSYPINRNIFAALQALRHPDRMRYLWIDSLCINQVDLVEKSVQVRGMLAIYRKASKVIVWLGEKGSGNRAIDYLKGAPFRVRHRKQCMRGLCRMYSDIVSLFERPWFRRTWVRQEVFAARPLEVQCGNVHLSWEELLLARQCLQSIGSQLYAEGVEFAPFDPDIFLPLLHLQQATPAAIGCVTETDRAYLQPRTRADRRKSGLELVNVLSISGLFQATDTRDFVYGVLGMTDTATRLSKKGVTIDYTKSPSEVFQDVVKHVINRDRELDILCKAGLSLSTDASLPSWVPDWPHQLPTLEVDEILGLDRYNGKTYMEPPYQSESDTGVLRLHGISFARLKPIGLGSRITKKLNNNALLGGRWPRGITFEDPPRFIRVDLEYIPLRKVSRRISFVEPQVLYPNVDLVETYIQNSNCLVPAVAAYGDLLVLFQGSILPMILRPARLLTGTLTYSLIGPALLDMLVREEGSSDISLDVFFRSELYEPEDFHLV